MTTIKSKDGHYDVDAAGFLKHSELWDEGFATALAPEFGIANELTDDHWRVIHYIRQSAAERGKCPLIYETARACKLRLRQLEMLFPAGYLRGACRLAGMTYRQGYHGSTAAPVGGAPPARQDQPSHTEPRSVSSQARSYRIDLRGFLLDADAWDEEYAAHRAYDLKMPGLTKDHWRILRYLRESFAARGVVPTVYETCTHHGMELEDLEDLFPDGYHRGAVKLAGLRVV